MNKKISLLGVCFAIVFIQMLEASYSFKVIVKYPFSSLKCGKWEMGSNLYILHYPFDKKCFFE